MSAAVTQHTAGNAPAPSRAEQQILDHFGAAATRLFAGDAHLPELRQSAIDAFARTGLPHRRVEEWKYTDLRARLREAFAPDDTAGALGEDEIAIARGALGGLDAHLCIFINARHHAGAKSADGLDMMALSEAMQAQPGWFEARFGQINPQPDDPVGQLSTAFVRDGAALHVHKTGSGAPVTVHLLFVHRTERPATTATRNLIIVDPGADVTIIEHHVSLSQSPVQTYAMTEIEVGDGARVRHVKLQQENAGSVHLSSWHAQLNAGADYRVAQVNLGGELTRNQLFVRYGGEGASAMINCVSLGRAAQHFDTTMLIDHAVPHCTSRELFKAVLDDKSRAVFQAKVLVRPDAQKTDGKQMAQALLLSDEAEFDSKPELEIYADDVVCGHGSTSGQIDEDLLFYLRARGIPEDEARALLITAFIDEAFDIIEDEKLHEALGGYSTAWLKGSEPALG